MTVAEEAAVGRELDALVAKKVMGWTVELKISSPREAFEEWRDSRGWRYGPNAKPYSTDIAAAMEVVERLRELDREPHKSSWLPYERTLRIEQTADGEWRVRFAYDADLDCSHLVEDYYGAMADAKTLPLAICRAALAAVAPL